MREDDSDIRWIEEPELGLSGRMYLPLFVQGLTTTMKHLVSPKVTVSYPDQEPDIGNPQIYRGVHRLNRDHQGRITASYLLRNGSERPLESLDIV